MTIILKQLNDFYSLFACQIPICRAGNRVKLHTFLLFLPTFTHLFTALSQQKENFCLPKVLFLFIQAAGLAYHWMYTSPQARYTFVYHQGRRAALVSHHAIACIQERQAFLFLRLDDIQHFVLMIYRNKLRMIYNASHWWYTRLRRDWDARMRKALELPCKIWYNIFWREWLYG